MKKQEEINNLLEKHFPAKYYGNSIREHILEFTEDVVKLFTIHDVSNCTCGKEKRYCKGCLCDVTETMYCYCGEQPLTKESTYTDDDLKRMNV